MNHYKILDEDNLIVKECDSTKYLIQYGKSLHETSQKSLTVEVFSEKGIKIKRMSLYEYMNNMNSVI